MQILGCSEQHFLAALGLSSPEICAKVKMEKIMIEYRLLATVSLYREKDILAYDLVVS